MKGAANRSAVGALVERSSRFIILAQMQDCSSLSALNGFSRVLTELQPSLCKRPASHERPAFLTWQAYYLRLTGKRDAVACSDWGARLIARHLLLSRRGQDPPHPRSFFSTLDA